MRDKRWQKANTYGRPLERQAPPKKRRPWLWCVLGLFVVLVAATGTALVKFVLMPPRPVVSATGAVTLAPLSSKTAATDAAEPSTPVTSSGEQSEPIGRRVEITPPVLPKVDEVRLQITASANCWLRVTADDKVVYTGTLHPGDTRTWQASQTLKVSFGRAGVVRLQLNGVSLGAAGAGSLTRTFSRRVAAEALAYARSH